MSYSVSESKRESNATTCFVCLLRQENLERKITFVSDLIKGPEFPDRILQSLFGHFISYPILINLLKKHGFSILLPSSYPFSLSS